MRGRGNLWSGRSERVAGVRIGLDEDKARLEGASHGKIHSFGNEILATITRMRCTTKSTPKRGEISSGDGLLVWRWRLYREGRGGTNRCPIVEPPGYIFNNPVDTLNDIVSSHSTAWHD